MTESIIRIIDRMMAVKKPLLVAIDGRCASGKTTLAMALQAHYGCNVIHMDHFFLRPEQRTEARLCMPGENVDHERFQEEVLIPLQKGESFCYRPFHCGSQSLTEPILVSQNPLIIIEGSYACHKNLRELYDLRLFLSVDPDEQMRRIKLRNGSEQAAVFKSKWIPLEEQYFSTFKVEQHVDYCFSTSEGR